MNQLESMTRHSPRQNDLLAALPKHDYERLSGSLELVPLPLGRSVYEAGGALDYVYFPTDCIVSLLSVTQDGSSAEIAIAGNEGLVGIALYMGGETTSGRAVVQNAGYAYRVPAAVIKQEFNRGGAFFSYCCCATRKRSSRRCRRPRCATAITRWSSSCAAGFC
jgi:hypothetical protein